VRSWKPNYRASAQCVREAEARCDWSSAKGAFGDFLRNTPPTTMRCGVTFRLGRTRPAHRAIGLRVPDPWRATQFQRQKLLSKSRACAGRSTRASGAKRIFEGPAAITPPFIQNNLLGAHFNVQRLYRCSRSSSSSSMFSGHAHIQRSSAGGPFS